MADSARSVSPSGYLLPFTTALLAFVFARVFDPPSSESSRPVARAFAEDPTVGNGEVESLLTQDPLEVAYQQGVSCSAPTAEGLRAALHPPAEFQGQDSEGGTLVLIMLARGGPWPEDRKFRVRQRYAVVSALTQAGFYAVHERSLQVFRLSGQPAVIVPHEEYLTGKEESLCRQQGRPPYAKACVLWLDERAIGKAPYGFAQDLCSELGLHESGLDVRVVGPSSSGELDRWLADAERMAREPAAVRHPLRLYSPYATVPDGKLHGGGAANPDYLELIRTIDTDDHLAEQLMLELRERLPSLMTFGAVRSQEADAPNPVEVERNRAMKSTVGLGVMAKILGLIGFIPELEEEVRVALVVEKDSLYGRRWCDHLVEARERLKARDQMFAKIRFEEFPYLSVLDGQKLRTDSQEAELPNDGASQVDFIERIGSTLESLGGPAAIGILGSDTYDVLLVLGALRARFPDAVFFTTDLDAEFSETCHLSATRNLVVASHLSLLEEQAEPAGEAEQCSVQPGAISFRDAYQLSVHRTVQRIAWGVEDDMLRLAPRSPPRLFEIGERGPVELNTNSMWSGPEACPRPAGPRPALLRFARGLPWWRETLASEASVPTGRLTPGIAVWLFCGMLFLFVLVVVVGHKPGTFDEQTPMQRVRRILPASAMPVLGTLALLGLIIDIEEASRHAAGEPLLFASGVSVWPTVILRLAAAVICLWGILRVRRGVIVLCGRLLESLRSEAPLGVTFPWKWLFSLCDAGTTRQQDLGRVIRLLGPKATNPRLLATRLTVYTAVNLLALAPVFRLARLGSPARGEFAYVWERLSIALLVVSFLALVSYVLEVAFVGQRLVLRIVDERVSMLPEGALNDEARRTGLTGRMLEIRIRLRLVRQITRFTDRIVLWPAVAVALMIFSRAGAFDRWSWPLALIFTQALYFLLLVLCVWNNRRAALEYRSQARVAVSEELLNSDAGPGAGRLEALKREIAELRGGAFSPLLLRPVFQSLLWPVLAVLASRLIEGPSLVPWLSLGG